MKKNDIKKNVVPYVVLLAIIVVIAYVFNFMDKEVFLRIYTP